MTNVKVTAMRCQDCLQDLGGLANRRLPQVLDTRTMRIAEGYCTLCGGQVAFVTEPTDESVTLA